MMCWVMFSKALNPFYPPELKMSHSSKDKNYNIAKELGTWIQISQGNRKPVGTK